MIQQLVTLSIYGHEAIVFRHPYIADTQIYRFSQDSIFFLASMVCEN